MIKRQSKRQETGSTGSPSSTRTAPSASPSSNLPPAGFPSGSPLPPPPGPPGPPPPGWPSGVPPPPPPPWELPPPSSSPGATAIAAIVGGVVGGIVLIVLILASLFFYLRSSRRSQQKRTSTDLPLQNNWLRLSQRGGRLKDQDSMLVAKSQEDVHDRYLGGDEKAAADDYARMSAVEDDRGQEPFFVAPFPVPVPAGSLSPIQEVSSAHSMYAPRIDSSFYPPFVPPTSAGHFDQSSEPSYSPHSPPARSDQVFSSESDGSHQGMTSGQPTDQDRQFGSNPTRDAADGIQFGKAF